MLMKAGVASTSHDGALQILIAIFRTPTLFAGFALYGLSAALLVIALKYGELSILYPVIALTYVWVTALSVLIYNEIVNPMKMLKQVQQAQERMQKEIAELSVSAAAGVDMVTVTMNGKKELVALKIDPEVVDKDDVEMLQDLILAAVNECGRKIDDEVQAKVAGLTAGMKLPGF